MSDILKTEKKLKIMRANMVRKLSRKYRTNQPGLVACETITLSARPQGLPLKIYVYRF